MIDLNKIKVAIVADWIKDIWWAEKVVIDILDLFPNADIFTSVFLQQKNPVFAWKKITTSFLQKIPILNKLHKIIPFLRPMAFENFDLNEYDLVISSSSAESKWVITKPETIHICYCHTPTRYFWSHYHEYFNRLEFGIFNFLARFFMPIIINKLRVWDYCAAQRVDYFIANSINTANRISKYYKRDSEVIYPWVNINSFIFSEKKKDFYFYIWRVVPYKNFDLIVDAFNKNWKELILATSTNNFLYKKLKRKSKSNIKWIFWITDEEKKLYFSEAKAVLFPVEEDFWIVPIEAMASWTPVIAYKKWWSLETVRENHKYMESTWVFFDEQTVENFNKAIDKFELLNFDYNKIREHAYDFNISIFKKKMLEFINSKFDKN